MTAVRVALSNDYQITLHGVAAMLAEHADRVVVVELTTSPRMTSDVDVILFDAFGRLPRADEKLREVIRSNRTKVVVYSWTAYPTEDARANGAAGYIHKGLDAEELVDAIVAIHEGRVWEPRDPHVTEDHDAMRAWPGQEFDLSARESEMLTFIARGYSNQEIADRVYLSINTVKTYVRTAYRKIGVQRRSQAVAWALSNGFRPYPPVPVIDGLGDPA
jgi:NarL family two-component system response regulator LiaR